MLDLVYIFLPMKILLVCYTQINPRMATDYVVLS